MPTYRLAAWLTLAVAFALTARGGTAAGKPLPALPVTTLTGTELDVPAGLPEAPCILIVGFSRAAGKQTTGWSRRLREAPATSNGCIFEVAVLTYVPRFIRGYVIDKIREGVPERFHSTFLTATRSEAEWKQFAGFSEPDAAYVLVVSAQRVVVSRHVGTVTDQAFAGLAGQVASASATP